MAISATVGWNENSTNYTTKLLNSESIVHVSGTFDGLVNLQISPDGANNWLTIFTFKEAGAIPISSQDPTMDYRFTLALTSGTVHLYLGA